MRYNFNEWATIDKELGLQMLVVEQIKRQKQKVNNDKRLREDEKRLIMYGLDLATDRTWSANIERHLVEAPVREEQNDPKRNFTES